MKKSSRFQESAKYVFLPYIPIATILIVISKEKNAKIMSSKICNATCETEIKKCYPIKNIVDC